MTDPDDDERQRRRDRFAQAVDAADEKGLDDREWLARQFEALPTDPDEVQVLDELAPGDA